MKFTSTTTLIMAVMASVLTGTASAAPSAGEAKLVRRKTYLGPVDMRTACKDQNGPDWREERIGEHSGDWKCRGPNGEWRDVNVNSACAVQWSWPEAWAEHGSGWNTWKCYH